MMKWLNDLKGFYRQHRIWVLGGLFFLLMMQVCSYGARVDHRSAETIAGPNEEMQAPDQQPLTPAPYEPAGERQPLQNNILLLVGLGLLFYFVLKRQWLQKLLPPIVWISLNFRKLRSSKTTLARIAVINRTDESITFESPVLVFGSPFRKSRKFRLKNSDSLFPLTLTPNTSHSLNIDIRQFRMKAGLVSAYRWIRVEVDSNRQKTYKSIWKYQML